MKIAERRYWRRSSVVMANFKYISYLFLVSYVHFDKLNVCWADEKNCI